MKKILVIGGTRFVGNRLVEKLISAGYDVTIANRGLTGDSFGDGVKRIIINRWESVSMQQLKNNDWDIVVDFICFNAMDALDAVRAFAGNIGRYIQISSQAVYEFSDAPLMESDFNSANFELVWKMRSDYEYAEGKRFAEAVINQMADFPSIFVRFPYILGNDDYTRRLDFYVHHILNKIPIKVSNFQSVISLISSDEAARFLFWTVENDSIEGAMNACSNGNMTTSQFLNTVAAACGHDFVFSPEHSSEHQKGSYDSEHSWCMSNTLATIKGFKFDSISDWLTALVEHSRNNIPN
ncbi:NAD-dependent epimerase/dehydratase family protein [Paenibacillus sp. FSL H7-689]|uniref:NAD-dependent epimerase/dehydratase family protein n=1 Tax=Paenibacillus sp. FSL H7-689 TaxID=1227349 RepID=UPI0003E25049|nr:NAD-dependent epimerase/dehydratase family protein [Paenibacillus sp. FSL H7-689]ETT44835.1 hypothetical protein C170_23075 [Paenibacillus sp. FSL H7-689]